MAIIEAIGLTKYYGQVAAVDGLSFSVEAGQVVGFLGPNGAGKTTTLRMLLGLIRPDEGNAVVDGEPYTSLRAPACRVGAMLEASNCHPGRNARNHLRIQALAAGIDPGRADDALNLVGLSEAACRRAGTFSLGMRQRLSLAAALVADPGVLILDEPANGLDPEGVRWLRDLIRDRAANGAAVLVSSHLLAEVAQTVDAVIIINSGRLVAEAPIGELTAGVALEDVFLGLTSPTRAAR
jgi:ABC-2 type transport system ATP-binding protein